LATQYPTNDRYALLYIHGLDNSFSDAAEHFGQICIDLEYDGVPIFFSWPSDVGRIYRYMPNTGILQPAYRRALEVSKTSEPYVVDAMNQLTNGAKVPFDVLAHSMGTNLATKAIILREMLRDRDALSNPRNHLEESPISVILAAPDISTKEFNEDLRPQLVRPNRYVVVYCSDDYALSVSQHYNRSDQRLGYCATATSRMPGVDIVTVKGPVEDLAHHSYYLSTIDVLDDIRYALLGNRTGSIGMPSGSGGLREIQIPRQPTQLR
jgi:esterase/lipase superfamily enzyme